MLSPFISTYLLLLDIFSKALPSQINTATPHSNGIFFLIAGGFESGPTCLEPTLAFL